MRMDFDPSEVSSHDKLVLDKVMQIANESPNNFAKALEKADVLGMMNLYYDEIIAHIEDLVDELESSEIKAALLLFLVELKASLVGPRAKAKAEFDYLNGNA